MTDELQTYIANAVRFEGCVPYMYQDVRGYVTVGVGHLVRNPDDAILLPFTQSGERATDNQIANDYARVKRLPPGMSHEHYASHDPLTLSVTCINDLLESHLAKTCLPGCRHLFPGFDTYPTPAKECLVDVDYSLGNGGLGTFVQLRRACAERRFYDASNQVHVSTSRDVRNQWRRDCMIAAAKEIEG